MSPARLCRLEGVMQRILIACMFFLAFAGAQAHSQALQPGDSIAISVFQDSKLDRQMIIGPTGMISFPLTGQLRAGGLTPTELANDIKNRLKDKYTSDLDITVSLLAQ